MINLYKAEYDRQHPKASTLWLKLLSIIIAVTIVLIVSTLDANAATEYSGIRMTAEERVLLEKIVAAESQTQGTEGRKAVVEVIFNRVLSDDYPDSIGAVLSQKGQFASYKHRNASWVVPELATEAIDAVITDGRTVLPDTDYVYFSRGKSSFGRDYIKIQDHWFGRQK